MLKINNLQAGYDNVKVLNGITLEANPSQVSLIIGPNGSGKSTILKSIYNIANVFDGEIELDGISLVGLKPYELIKEGVSFVLQRNVIFGTLSVYENLQVAANKYDDREVAKKEIENVIEKFDFLDKMRNSRANILSGGQQRLLAIAMALLQKPKVILLDEPSAGLSPKMVGEVFDMIEIVKKEGVTILLVEQNVRLATNIADKIYVLEKGKIVVFGGKEVLKNKKIRDVYLGK